MNSPETAELLRKLSGIEGRLAAVERSNSLERASVLASDTRSVNVKRALLDSTATQLAAANVLAATVTAADYADGLITIFYTDVAPTVGVTVGDRWMTSAQVLSRFGGTTWALDPSAELATALTTLGDSLTILDGTLITYWAGTMPIGGSYGDLWFDTDHNRTPYMWNDAWRALIVTSGQSGNYVPGGVGWHLAEDGTFEVGDLQSTGELGATTINADVLVLDGVDIEERLDAFPLGGSRTYVAPVGTNLGPVTTTETRLFEVNAGELRAGRQYSIHLAGHCVRTATGDSFDFRWRYTTDGSAPTTSSTEAQHRMRWTTSALNEDIDRWIPFTPTVTGPHRFILTLLNSGTVAGSLALHRTTQPYAPRVMIRDEGPKWDTSAQATWDGSAPVVAKTYVANYTWWGTYQEWIPDDSLFPISYDPSTGAALTAMAVGYRPTANYDYLADYRYLGMLGFNYSAIVAALTPWSTITGVTLTYKIKSRRVASATYSMSMRIGTHILTNTSAPTDTVPASSTKFTENRVARNTAVPGSTYTDQLGATAAGQFKTGAARGIILTPPNTNAAHDGEVYPAGAKLTFTGTGV